MSSKAVWIPLFVAVAAGVAWGFGSEEAAAQLFAAVAILVVTLLLFTTGPERPIALVPFEYDNEKKVEANVEVPRDALDDEDVREGVEYKLQHGLYFRGLYVGKDGRWSTSRLQVLLWTYAVLYALASIFIATALGDDDGLTKLLDMPDEQWATYLILLGGPFAAVVLAQAITESKVNNETVAKSGAKETSNVGEGLGQVISNDAGETDIVDLQYFLFNVLALGYFLFTFVPDLPKGLPELPELLVVLTGASAATYIGKKAAEQAQPKITAVLPAKVRAGGKLDVWGESLVLGEVGREDRKPRVSLGALEADSVELVQDTRSGGDHLMVAVPMKAAAGATTLRAVTLAGVAAEHPLEIESAVVIYAVNTGKVEPAKGDSIVIAGEGFGAQGGAAAVLLDGVPLEPTDWEERSITARPDPDAAYAPNMQASLVVQNADGQRSDAHTLVVA